ncbi:hypothetical protein HPB51_007703 [Rhipicephalus microplus]|uniref:Protein SDA1 n=1 Tax=Rhipicephalus microplus TaxID=6941 RepID=A0A9J6DT21_RHIMP|nr:hypothetical protein HPB51_007703 [Rhipicephalus microplus]
MLARKFRGKPTEETQELKALKYGELKAPSFVPGAEVLEVDGEEENNDEENDSDDEDDDSDGWVDVQHSDDEAPDPEPGHENKTEQGADSAKKKGKSLLNLEERAQKAALVSETRILSQQEFAKVRAAQLSKKMKAAIPQRFTKKGAATTKTGATTATAEVPDATIGEKKEIVSLRDIEKLVKNPRSTKESRLASIKEGREDREKFGGRKKKKGEFASQSNKEKRKTKVFNMVKHKLKRKQKRSFREKQASSASLGNNLTP